MAAPFATRAAARFAGEWVIDVRNVDKQYRSGLLGRGRVHALRGIDLRVHRGSVFGLLGPNGAGKSTLVKILMTVIRATRCEGTFLGAPVGHKPTLRRVGYLPEHHRFPDYLTAAQVLDFFGALSDVPRGERRRRSRELLALVGLTNWSNKKVKGFSKGMRQRLGIANALMSDPDLVVLDEPTDGVDPVGRRDIRNILARLREEGRTVFLNSHLLSELEMVCDRVAILVQGVVSSQGTIEELTRHSRRYEIEVAPGDDRASREAVAAAVAPLSLGIPVSVSGLTVTVGTDDTAAIQPVIDALRAHGAAIRAVRQARASLEDLFMQAVTDPSTGRAIAPGAASAARGEAGNAARGGLGIETGARP